MVKELDHLMWQHTCARSDSGSSLTSLSTMYTSLSDSDDQLDELAIQLSEVSLAENNAENPPTTEELYPMLFPLEDGEV